MKVKLWGTRGSLPSPITPQLGAQKVRELLEGFFSAGFRTAEQIPKYIDSLPVHRLGGYGGNTPCIEVKSDKQQIMIDAGSGLRLLGQELMAGPCGRGAGEVHLLFTHFHWDHLIGLPFFIPLFIPGNTVHVYSVQPELKKVFELLFQKPYFPVPLSQIGARIEYHQLTPRQSHTVGDINFTPYQLDHPDPCWGFKIQTGDRVFSYCVDTEGSRASRERLGDDLPLYQGVDLMIYDAQYTLIETIEKINWGHAAASIGLDIAMREGIKRVLFMHHDPGADDEKIAFAEAEARRYYKAQLKSSSASKRLHEVEWSFAQEGLLIDV